MTKLERLYVSYFYLIVNTKALMTKIKESLTFYYYKQLIYIKKIPISLSLHN